MTRRLLVALLSLALTWAALEVGFARTTPALGTAATGERVRSVLQPKSDQVERWSRRLEHLRERPRAAGLQSFSPRYGWWNAPGAEGEQGGVSARVNEVGARGARAWTAAPPEGALRVVCYGESFTFGTEVGDDETWPAQLEAQAAGQLEVWNLGVGGWGTDQALLRARDTRETLGADVVLLGLLNENIGRNVNRVRNAYWPETGLPMVKPRFLLRGGALELLPQPYTSERALYEAAVSGSLGLDLAPHEYWAPTGTVLGSHVLGGLARRRARGRRFEWSRLWDEPAGEPFRVTTAIVDTFVGEATRAGARFVGVVLFATERDLDAGLAGVARPLARRGVVVLDTSPVLRVLVERGEAAYGADHLTPAGNGAVAAAVLAWLREQL